MQKINYTKQFIDYVNYCNNNNLYVGSGNPEAKIAIIGKEVAIDSEKSISEFNQYNNETALWLKNIENKTQLNEVKSWFDSNPVFNPLYPYKGQKNIVETHTKKGVKGKGGTSKTWHNYQKIADGLTTETSSNSINFHEHIFCTELNNIPAKYSHEINKDIRKKSIENRLPLFELDFFDQFDVIIVAAGHYIRDFNINLENIFNVRYNHELSQELSLGLNKEYINIHQHNTNPNKILIHTNQLSMVSNELINRLIKTIKKG
jgi:hypothetical protein